MTKKQSTPLDSSDLKPRFLALKYGTSKAADSYGYNRVVLTDTRTGKKFVAVGGGYDMTGAVLGEWMEATFQYRLNELQPDTLTLGPYPRKLYGIRYKGTTSASGHVAPHATVDGACGRDSMVDICMVCGIAVEGVYDRSSRRVSCLGFDVRPTEAGAA